HELRVRLHVPRRIDRLLVPLDQAHRVGETAVLFGRRRGGNEEHLGLDVLRVHAGLFPHLGGLRQEDVDHHPPVQPLPTRPPPPRRGSPCNPARASFALGPPTAGF